MVKTNVTNNLPQKSAPIDAEAQALLDEVDAEVKAEQLKNFLTRYGNVIIAILVIAVLGTALGTTLTNMKTRNQETDSEKLITLLDKELDKVSPDEAKATLLDLHKMAAEGSGEGHRIAARLGEAGIQLTTNQYDDGIKSLQALSADHSVQPLYRDYAKLLELRARADKDDAQKIIDELAPLLDAKNPWHISALELSAVLYAKLGQKDKAVEQLNKLVIDVDASSAVVERAKLLSRVYKAQ
ncbi:MAG: hypothetical protein EB059_07280 [Alphaproteobacteria bacterium]|nr:hypothetical protein [Alphaproteobacteria bacterium]